MTWPVRRVVAVVAVPQMLQAGHDEVQFQLEGLWDAVAQDPAQARHLLGGSSARARRTSVTVGCSPKCLVTRMSLALEKTIRVTRLRATMASASSKPPSTRLSTNASAGIRTPAPGSRVISSDSEASRSSTRRTPRA
ncbi:hypothetical protein FrEUN1fDRAFT_0454 [Parafrankia sp. EUN1f]|nr:hypothetical protein FrEUN1fDRAFT_0454 [Parafrankia sp. EUN1f]